MKAQLTVYADKKRNNISKNLFGHFMEHAGDIIYDGIYDPENPLSDDPCSGKAGIMRGYKNVVI